jgi:2-dehydropantoate 2-reductase
VTRRYVVFGAGAIGGAMAAFLDRAGLEVAVVARGAHLAAIRERGLTLRTPEGDATVHVLAAGSAGEIRWRDDDVVLLAVKSQDTDAALHDLTAAVPPSVSVVCAQNGVANERAALRRFESTLGMWVICPATHLAPGVVEADSSPCPGVMDVGRFPAGVDAVAEEVAAALRAATFDSRAVPDVMRWKYAKLLSNLGNAIEAVCGPQAGGGELAKVVRHEGEAVLRAAGIAHASWAASSSRSAPSTGGDGSGAPRGRAWRAQPAASRPTTSTGRSCCWAASTGCRRRPTTSSNASPTGWHGSGSCPVRWGRARSSRR